MLIANAAAATTGPSRTVLASAGCLAIFNLAVTDNERYAGAKRAFARVKGMPSGQMGLAKRWYDLVRFHVLGQLIGVVWMVRACSPAGALRGGSAFMAANVLFFIGGAAAAKHDKDGLPAPIKPSLVKFIAGVDSILLLAACFASKCATGTLGHAIGSYVFAAGCMIGAAEGLPKTVATVQKLIL